MYEKIYEFCKVKNKGTVYKNGTEITPRVEYLMKLIKSMGIEYELDTFEHKTINEEELTSTSDKIRFNCYNIIMRGNSSKMVVAHHDIVNPNSDNANDNSASVINAIMLKKLMPEINVVLLDGEEPGGFGSQHLSDQINNNEFGRIEWVLNLELTGRGGKYFFIGELPGPLYNHIKGLFGCPSMKTPFNDSWIFRENNIDSVVINPLPTTEISNMKYGDVYLDMSILYNCHSMKDSLDTISTADMKEFVEEVLVKILK